jgi:cyclopropane-fatty-acyl-phospholipid synthase
MTVVPDRSLLGRVTASPWNYWAAFVTDAVAAGAFGWAGAARYRGPMLVGLSLVAGGVLAWTLIEYLLHRCVLHGLPIAAREHAKHHRDPRALISTPMLLIPLLSLLVFLAFALALPAGAAALATFGLYAGYNVFAIVHHLQHFHPEVLARWPLFARTLHLHELHHRHPDTHYGISVGFWDRVFGTRVK